MIKIKNDELCVPHIFFITSATSETKSTTAVSATQLSVTFTTWTSKLKLKLTADSTSCKY